MTQMDSLYPPDYGYGPTAFLSASGMMWEQHYRTPPPESPSPKPESTSVSTSVSTVILPPRVEEELRAERERKREREVRDANSRTMAALFGVPTASWGSLGRGLTDDECVERYGATVDDLRESVEFWRRRVQSLTKRKHRAERHDAEQSLSRARLVLEEAQTARVYDD